MTPADLVAVATIGSSSQVLTDFTSEQGAGPRGASAFSRADGTATRRRRREHRGDRRSQRDGDRRHDGRRRERAGARHVQQRRAAARAEDARRGAGADRAEEGDPLFQLRACSAAARTTRSSCARRSTRRSARTWRSTRSTRAGCRRSSPAASARRAAAAGIGAFSGRGVPQQFTQLAAQQETLTSLAADTGGRAFTDSNDFGEAFAQVRARHLRRTTSSATQHESRRRTAASGASGPREEPAS